MAEENRLRQAEALAGGEETAAHYDAWSATYDTDLVRGGWAAPERCARALARFVEHKNAALLDLGCGTGLSGEAFVAQGFTDLHGVDISDQALARAREKGIYRVLDRMDLSVPWPFVRGAYPMVACVGSLAPGHLPAAIIDAVIENLPPGGHFVFSLSERARAEGDYLGRLNDQLDAGPVELLLREDGPYLPAEGMTAEVYVLRRR